MSWRSDKSSVVGSFPTQGNKLFSFSLSGLVMRQSAPLNTQGLENYMESEEQRILTLGSLYITLIYAGFIARTKKIKTQFKMHNYCF